MGQQATPILQGTHATSYCYEKAMKIRHTGIVVTDMTQATRFYRDLLGLRLIYWETESNDQLDECLGLRSVQVEIAKLEDEENGVIELLKYKFPEGRKRGNKINDFGISHVAFTLPDLDTFYQETQNEVLFSCPPQKFPNGVKMTFCQDPDGNHVELVQLP